ARPGPSTSATCLTIGSAVPAGATSPVNDIDTKSGSPPSIMVGTRSEEHTSELQSLTNLVCRLLLEKKKDDDVGELQSGQPRERERHRGCARLQALDSVLTGGIARRHAESFNQCWSRRWDGDAGQHGGRRVSGSAGEGGLRQRDRGNDHQTANRNECSHDNAHTDSFATVAFRGSGATLIQENPASEHEYLA